MNTLGQLGQPMPDDLGQNMLPPGGRPSTPEEIEMIQRMLQTRPPGMTPAPMPRVPNTEQDLLRRLQQPPPNPNTEFPDLMRRPGPQGVPMSGMQPPVTLASMGQRYKDMPPATFDQRFGPFQGSPQSGGLTHLDSQELLRLLRQKADEQQLRSTPGAIVPGQEMIDYNGYRGVRHPSGYYLTRGI